MSGIILLIEDNEQIIQGNERMLKRRGYEVLTAMTLGEARDILKYKEPGVIVLDIMLPDGSGLDFMCELRQFSDVPVLLLTGLSTPDDIIKGLSEGGDDYLTKPYDFHVLLARIGALIRRAQRLPDTLAKGNLRLDIVAGQAFCNDKNLHLPKKEFALLMILIKNEDKTLSAEYLYEKVWSAPLIGNMSALKNAISRLRAKLIGSGYTVSAMRCEGYVFERE